MPDNFQRCYPEYARVLGLGTLDLGFTRYTFGTQIKP